MHLKLGALENAQKCEEKDAFYASVDDSLASALSRGAPEGTFDCALKDALRVMGACEIVQKGALEVPFELHLWLHLLMQQLMDKFLQNSSSNCEPDALEGALRGELNVEFARAPYSTL